MPSSGNIYLWSTSFCQTLHMDYFLYFPISFMIRWHHYSHFTGEKSDWKKFSFSPRSHNQLVAVLRYEPLLVTESSRLFNSPDTLSPTRQRDKDKYVPTPSEISVKQMQGINILFHGYWLGIIFYENMKAVFKYLKYCGWGRQNDPRVYILQRGSFGYNLKDFQHLDTVRRWSASGGIEFPSLELCRQADWPLVTNRGNLYIR